jgi:hypothetical protein
MSEKYLVIGHNCPFQMLTYLQFMVIFSFHSTVYNLWKLEFSYLTHTLYFLKSRQFLKWSRNPYP